MFHYHGFYRIYEDYELVVTVPALFYLRKECVKKLTWTKIDACRRKSKNCPRFPLQKRYLLYLPFGKTSGRGRLKG